MLLLLCFFLFLSGFSHFHISASAQSRCKYEVEVSALLQFKDSFQINCTDSYGRNLGYPKMFSWITTESLFNGTVVWDGVKCNPVSGHVISLDLSSSCLHGSINNNIFSVLVHLEHLNLAFNDFNVSSIPSKLGRLSRLNYLNLSSSSFYGQVPLGISNLSMLTSLDLSNNLDLELNLNSLVENLTNLEELDLSWTNINSKVPKWLFTNISSLRSLKLAYSGLYGEFPQGIFHLPNLQHLSIGYNWKLEGHLPTDFNSSTTPLLESLVLHNTNFSGVIPDSIGNLVMLKELYLYECKFSGHISVSLGNLTHLIALDLSYNTFSSDSRTLSSMSSWMGKLTNLESLVISGANLKGEIPSVLTKLTQLSVLDLGNNQLTGEIPSGLFNLTKLNGLDLSNNKLHGPLPIGNLINLVLLDVSNNTLSDILELDMFLGFRNLTYLSLSSNNLTLLQQRNASTTTSTLPQFVSLGLSSCRLFKFPELLMHQQRLLDLDLSYNNIEGPIPNWMGSSNTLYYMDLSHNFITNHNDSHSFVRWPKLEYLDISYNKLKGSVPIPSPSIIIYRASNNEFTGEIPHSICNSTSFYILDFSSNRLTGELDTHCIIKYDLAILNLRNNSFHGKIPEFCKSGTNSTTKMIDLNTNQFQGKFPRSLVNCVSLEFFDVGSNLINDIFPSWMGSLPQLKVLVLKDNALHGSIETTSKMRSGYWFPELIIIDISQNNLSGNLTSWHFEQWMAMKNISLFRNPSYMGQDMRESSYLGQSEFYDYSVTIYDKGMKTEYPKILDALITIDLSNNRLEAEIPSIMGDLRGLHFLNLSNNHLYGGIPSSLGALTELESLDLSSNELSGQIPQQLTELNFLSDFDVSNNNLTGLIPQGRHFDTFSNISYFGNLGLCGEPLSRKCETSGQEEAKQSQESRDNFWDDLNAKILWMVVAIGFGGWLVVGVAVENMFDWRMLILSWRSRRQLQRRINR